MSPVYHIPEHPRYEAVYSTPCKIKTAVLMRELRGNPAMQTSFQRSLAFTLEYEGGYCNDPNDKGGATKFGITIATLSHELGRRATISDVHNMTVETAATIYKKKYWATIGADGLPAGVDLLVFDISVNNGVGRALQWISLTSNMPVRERIERLHNLRMGFWKRLATWWRFGRGWTRRESACRALALKLAQGD